MKLGPLERWFVNSPMRRAMQVCVIRWFRAVMPLHPGAALLEIGCGAGAGARMLVRHFNPRRLYLTDIDFRMAVIIRRWLYFLNLQKKGPVVFSSDVSPKG